MNYKNQTQAKQETKLSYLGNINSSAKIMKNKKVSNNYTYILYLSPANTSGYSVCPFSTPECRKGCLATSGRTKVEEYAGKSVIKNARIKKTKLFFEQQTFFMDWLIAELISKQKKAKKDGYDFSVRLNGTSDIDWKNVYHNGKNIFELFPNVQFYDYTKNPAIAENAPANYHITFSYTGYQKNVEYCKDLLSKGKNVAVVFDVKDEKDLPTTFMNYPVINGDLTDYRPLDGQGVVVGLKWKTIANKALNDEIRSSCFVIR